VCIVLIVHCNKCSDEFCSIEDFEQHWRDKHLEEYGWGSAQATVATEWGGGALFGRDEKRVDLTEDIDKTVDFVDRYKSKIGAVFLAFGIIYLVVAYAWLHIWDRLQVYGSLGQWIINNQVRVWEYPLLGVSIVVLVIGSLLLLHYAVTHRLTH
jgi:hypothetical protein